MPRFALDGEGAKAVNAEGEMIEILAWNAKVGVNEENDEVTPVFANPDFVAVKIQMPDGMRYSYPEWEFLGWRNG